MRTTAAARASALVIFFLVSLNSLPVLAAALDLDERLAELEATAARAGNTKTSLRIYGQVN